MNQSKETFPNREERILLFWKNADIFQKSVDARKGGPLFSFYDGPPFATGLPHYGHLLAGTIKDVVPRYKTMKGFYVPRRFGWDCHGLPVENEIEKAKNLSGAPEIESFGIDSFNEECRSIVLRYTKEWKTTVSRMGRWVDFEKTYKTMDSSFMESVWWAFHEVYEKGLVYEGFKVMPFSAKLGTPLSNFEANLNYQDVDDPSLTVTFPLVSDPSTSLLAWTTTPWTLPSNLALAVGPEITYLKIQKKEKKQKFILAKDRLAFYFPDQKEIEILEEMEGKSLKGLEVEPLFNYFSGKKSPNTFRVLVDSFVTTEDGTGIVHMAPAFGEVDFFATKAAGIEVVCPVDHNGKFTKEVPDLEGLFVKDADKPIIKMLKEKGRVFRQETIRHRYPFCWRSDTPLIYRVVRTWFVAVEKIKDKLLKNNEEVRWIPNHIQKGRFGKWLENARDWAISRNRYWGTPIPIWKSDDGQIIVIKSISDLEKRIGKKINDLHRHFIDNLTFEEEGKTFKRIPEVFDCWFESGAMPYAQNHYPFENKKETMEEFPADFIAEGLDQTRGWFYTLNVLSAALFDKPAFKNVIVNGIILAEDGNKMSKRLKNYPEPGLLMDTYGADAVRLYLLGSGAVEAEDLRFSEKGVEQVMRQVMIPFWNAYHFFKTYADIYNWKPQQLESVTLNIDCWILSKTQQLIEEVSNAMDSYELNKAVAPFVSMIEQLTNWYIRRCRNRFWADKDTTDRREAFSSLYQVLMNLAKVAAPFIPFLSESLFLNLRKDGDPQSVHLCDFPEVNHELRNFELEEEMADTQAVVKLGHSLRKEHKIKVRQPLASAHIVCVDNKRLLALKRQEKLICEELNVHKVEFSDKEEGFVEFICKPNFRVLGKKVGSKMRSVQKIIKGFSREQLQVFIDGGSLEIEAELETFTLTLEDVQVERKVREGLIARSESGITIVLDTHLTEDLLIEGISRELINKINTMRRDAGFFVTDRIEILIDTTDRVKKAFKIHQEFVMNEVLGVSLRFDVNDGSDWDINGEKTRIALSVIVSKETS